jgi:hypothetical protein
MANATTAPSRRTKPNARSSNTTEQVSKLVQILKDGRPRTLEDLFASAALALSRQAVTALSKHASVFVKTHGRDTLKQLGTAIVSSGDAQLVAIQSDDLLVSLLQRKRGANVTRAHSVAELKVLLRTKSHQDAFAQATEERLRDGELPAGVGAIRRKQSVLLFLVEDAIGPLSHLGSMAAPARYVAGAAHGGHRTSIAEPPAAPAHAPDFDRAFETAFDHLARANRLNLVKLSALRAALPWADSAEFNQRLDVLRDQDRYVLQTFDGRHGQLTPEDEAAAIVEAGRRFVYVARKNHE